MHTLIGRDRERNRAAIFVAASASGPAVLEIDGEPGIGKTTLFRYTVDLARLGGSTVLERSPTHAESATSYVGLTDMLRAVADSAFDDLPAPQRHSLEVETLRTAPSEVPLDERAVGTGLAAVTATELQIAQLAATGLTTREVAERLFLSSKTVEANLARVYRKLGITARRARCANGPGLTADVSAVSRLSGLRRLRRGYTRPTNGGRA